MDNSLAHNLTRFKDTRLPVEERLKSFNLLKITQDPDVQKEILLHIIDSNYNFRDKIKEFLIAMGDETINTAKMFIDQLNETLLIELLEIIPEIKTELSYEFSSEFLEHKNKMVRAQAALALSSFQKEEDVFKLIPMLEDPDQRFQKKIIKALGLLKNLVAILPMMKLIENKILAPYVIDTVVSIGADAIESLSLALDEPMAPPYKKYLILEAFARLKNETSLDILYKYLNAKERALKRISVWAIGEVGSESSLPYLIEMLKKEPALSRHIETAIIKLYPFDISIIIEEYSNLDESAQLSVLKILKEVRDKESIEFLVDHLESETSDKLRLIIESLSSIGFEASCISLLYHENQLIQRLVLKIIPSGTGSFPFYAVKKIAIHSKNWKVRYRALYALFLKGRNLTEKEFKTFINDKNIFINALTLFIFSKEKTKKGLKYITKRLTRLCNSSRYTPQQYNFFLEKALDALKNTPGRATLLLLMKDNLFIKANMPNLIKKESVFSSVVKLLRYTDPEALI
ncbi:MAG: HEAT repeat domain-containing protein [Spirochaetes bacterium]|nr:HEAT repeat domain-containing protein [Spirochaetota bacterium]